MWLVVYRAAAGLVTNALHRLSARFLAGTRALSLLSTPSNAGLEHSGCCTLTSAASCELESSVPYAGQSIGFEQAIRHLIAKPSRLELKYLRWDVGCPAITLSL